MINSALHDAGDEAYMLAYKCTALVYMLGKHAILAAIWIALL